MASVAHTSAGSRLRRCENITAAKLLAQNTAVEAISRDAQRIAASQRSLHVQSLAQNLGLAMGLPLLLCAAAFLLPPAKASEWTAASTPFPREGGLNPYAAGNWMDSHNYMYLPHEEEEDFSTLIDAEQRAEEEGSSTVGDKFPAPADSELSFTEPKPTTGDGPPDVRQKNAEASTVEEDAEAIPPEKDDASTLGERGEASEHNGPVPSYTLPAAALRSDLHENKSESLSPLLAAAPGSDIDETVVETFAELLSRATDLLLTSAMPQAEAMNISATDNGPSNVPAADTLETEAEPDGEVEKVTVMESSGPIETGAAPEFQPDEEEELYKAATGPTGNDESVTIPSEASVPSQNVSLFLESEPQLSVRNPHPQPTNDRDTLAAEQELRDVAPLESGFSEELQVKSTPRAGVSASRGQTRKFFKKELPLKEMQRGETLEQQSRQSRGRSHHAAALYGEEEDAERTREKTESLRSAVKGTSRKRQKEMKAGVRWKNMLRLAAALGLAVAGAEAGLMYMNRSVDKQRLVHER